MAISDIGPLMGADEGLNHQIVDTFATVSESDHAWTEKLWATGTITVDGETTRLDGDAFGFRDHSWGVRQGVEWPELGLTAESDRAVAHA